MPTVRMFFEGGKITPKFARQAVRQRDLVLTSVRGAAQDVSDKTLVKARAQIARAGNFGARWQEGLGAPVTEGGGNIRINITHTLLKVGFRVHQFGATIKAKNSTGFLWFTSPRFPGKLFRKKQVTIRKRFRVLEIAREVSLTIDKLYAARLQKGQAKRG